MNDTKLHVYKQEEDQNFKAQKDMPKADREESRFAKTNNRTTGNRGTAGGDIVVFDSNMRRSDEA